jgi:hypothetical protein
MFQELNSALLLTGSGTDIRVLPHGTSALITDTLQADGSFILHHFLHLYLKAGKTVCLVGLEQSLFHYVSVGRKLVSMGLIINSNDEKGVNLSTEQTKAQFSFINALSTPYSSLNNSDQQNQTADSDFTFQEDSQPLRGLYFKIKEQINKSPAKDNGCCILIDSLNQLVTLCGAVEVSDFLQYCQVLVENQKVPNNNSCGFPLSINRLTLFVFRMNQLLSFCFMKRKKKMLLNYLHTGQISFFLLKSSKQDIPRI